MFKLIQVQQQPKSCSWIRFPHDKSILPAWVYLEVRTWHLLLLFLPTNRRLTPHTTNFHDNYYLFKLFPDFTRWCHSPHFHRLFRSWPYTHTHTQLFSPSSFYTKWKCVSHDKTRGERIKNEWLWNSGLISDLRLRANLHMQGKMPDWQKDLFCEPVTLT